MSMGVDSSSVNAAEAGIQAVLELEPKRNLDAGGSLSYQRAGMNFPSPERVDLDPVRVAMILNMKFGIIAHHKCLKASRSSQTICERDAKRLACRKSSLPRWRALPARPWVQ